MNPPAASEPGFDEAIRQVHRFAEELLNEAGAIAKRNESDEASAAHVRRAATHLYTSGSSRRGQILTSVGGVVAGASTSALVTFVVTRPIPVGPLTASIAALLIGAVLLTAGLMTRG